MGLESVEQLPLADVEHAHESLSASGDQQLLLRGVLQHSRSILMAGERWRVVGGRRTNRLKRPKKKKVKGIFSYFFRDWNVRMS